MYNVKAESIVREYEMAQQPLEECVAGVRINVISHTEDSIEFDLLGVPPSLANALRRILIAELPSVALHTASIRENDTVFPDEYVAHRLGLIPIDVDAELLGTAADCDAALDMLDFRLMVKNSTADVISLLSDQIEWVPRLGQEHLRVQIKPGVLVCKMAPGNTIDMSLTAARGIGRDHAKWSPVSLCSYRLMPRIVLGKDFGGEDARELQRCFSPGVIEIVDGRAVVANCRAESMSRNVFRHDKFKECVQILREPNWFCFTVETMAADPMFLLRSALHRLRQKCQSLKEEILQTHE
ncbi:DNA-directed RNA polymerases I and III subunit RPAC1 [Pancytospora philotis]|nr:DNA-directed RNA polymerases I and III subunit RPAC1 [Pancytospora philotis]